MDLARFGRTAWRRVLEVTDSPDALRRGFWAVVVTFEGTFTGVRLADPVSNRGGGAGGDLGAGAGHPDEDPARWRLSPGEWSTSLDRDGYERGVAEVRSRVAAGTVYQVNLCRVLSRPLDDEAHLPDLAALLAAGNPAPYAAVVHVPAAGLDVVCASPEAFLVRDGDRVLSRPVKGTAPPGVGMPAKDHAENVMITDLVRNDLARVCRPGTVVTERLCATERHPGLDHLVSDVAGRLRPGTGWEEVLAATFPPGSVSGAPKSSALATIRDLEPVPRGPYCGAVGWVDADADRAVLAVGIRTFWGATDLAGRRRLLFGAGAGITWGSDPALEWEETELKSRRLVGLASGRVVS